MAGFHRDRVALQVEQDVKEGNAAALPCRWPGHKQLVKPAVAQRAAPVKGTGLQGDAHTQMQGGPGACALGCEAKSWRGVAI